jgi:hypothetical protein
MYDWIPCRTSRASPALIIRWTGRRHLQRTVSTILMILRFLGISPWSCAVAKDRAYCVSRRTTTRSIVSRFTETKGPFSLRRRILLSLSLKTASDEDLYHFPPAMNLRGAWRLQKLLLVDSSHSQCTQLQNIRDDDDKCRQWPTNHACIGC